MDGVLVFEGVEQELACAEVVDGKFARGLLGELGGWLGAGGLVLCGWGNVRGLIGWPFKETP
jgi:hypothetical protein